MTRLPDYTALRNKKKHKSLILKLTILSLIFILSFITLKTEYVYSQSGSGYFNPRDNDYPLLGLKRMKEEYEINKKELERKKILLQDGQISQKEYDNFLITYNSSEVNYQQNLLKILFQDQYLSISNAVKYSSESGEKIVRITIKNSSNGSAELKKLINIDEDLFSAIEPDVINNIYINILNDDVIIGQPYEHRIERLGANQSKEVSFTLLQDLDIVRVVINYGNGATIDKKIYLQKDSTINKVELQSEQFSQEVELGSSASYDLSLELFSGAVDTFKLEVVNLPSQINRYFVTPGTDIRLSYFKFTESSSTKKASLKVFLPDRATETIKMGQSLKFYVLAIPQNRVKEINLDTSRHYTEEELIGMNVGYVGLDLVPRGIGELLVKAQQLFFSIKAGETVEVPIELVNDGTRALNNVEIDVDLPLNWTHSVEPKNISQLNVSEEKRAIISIIPSDDVAAGRYEVRVSTTSLSDEQPISGEDKTINVEIKAETNVIGMVIIILLILGLVGGMVVFGIRLSRR